MARTFRSPIATAVMRSCDKLGSLSYISHLWAEAIDHLSSDPQAVARLSSSTPVHQLLDDAFKAVKDATDPVAKRDALTFLAATAIWTALDGIKDMTVASHVPGSSN